MWNGQLIKQIALKTYCDLRLRAAVAGAFACVWWGILYPELCFTDGTYEQVTIVDGEEVEAEDQDYHSILGASGDEIVIKSRLLEWIQQKMSEQ